jgi:NitT/TauT family transport system ATP-binding protein
MAAPIVSLDRVDKRFDNGVTALQGVSLALAAHEFVALLGPSGCGKSTVLRLIAGLDVPSAGRVGSPAVGGDSPDTAYVFQEPTLMPWASLFDNVWLPLRLAGVSRSDAAAPVRAVLRTVGLSDFESSYPDELSGGMKMRASIARALVTRPRVLLMDEPFAALDELTRQKLNTDLLDWWRAQQLAALFVTHSVFEAVFLSQRVLVMGPRPGRIVAELAIDAAYPRRADFRMSTEYAQACRALSLALESAQARSEPAPQ